MTIAVVSMIRDPWGGSEELWYEMAKLALGQGHKLIWLGYETPVTHSKVKELESLGMARIARPGWIPPSASELKKNYFLTRNFFRKKINSPIKKLFKLEPDVVVYNGTCYSIANEPELIKYVQADKRVRFYIIGHLNNEFNRGINEIEAGSTRNAYRLSKKVFFVSNRSLETAKRQLCTEIPNAVIVKNPVNISSLERIPFPAINDTLQLACVGNLITVHKGQDILFEALSKWENKNWVLNLYGAGPDRSYLENLSKHLNLAGQIKFHGSVNDIRKLWEQNHALIMPSIMEGMPLALVEAMICGRICVATNVGGISEWISDEKNGFLIPAPTVSLILETLEKAWSLRNSWSEMATAAHMHALQLYDPNPGLSLLKNISSE